MTNPNPESSPNPFVGPGPIPRTMAIYGRDVEIREVLNLLIAERVVLLYSPSGAGKTSLIQAGLIGQLAEEGFHVPPLIRVHQQTPDPAIIPTNRYVFSTLLALEPPTDESKPPSGSCTDLAREELGDYLNRRWSRSQEIVLVFDQFEEILTADPSDVKAKHAFFAQLGAALADQRRWALFALREDYVAGLDPYLRHIPGRFGTRFRLDLLKPKAARQAIQQTALSGGVTFETAAARDLVENLSRTAGDGTTADQDEDVGRYVEPVQMQVVCRRLWTCPRANRKEITQVDVARHAQIDEALAAYYDEEMTAATNPTKAPGPGILRERALRDWVGRRLIIERRFRRQGSLSELPEDASYHEAVRQLIDKAHLIREEKSRGTTWFELAHDRLIRPVLAANDRWMTSLQPFQRRAVEWANQGRPSTRLLHGASLAGAEQWAKEHTRELAPEDKEFLAASHALRDQQSSLAALGWGVIFAHNADPLVREALAELLNHRRQQATQERVDYYREFVGGAGYRPGETGHQFLARHGVGAALAEWDKVPFYLLLVGDPVAIPFEFQYDLAERYAVGRLHLETAEQYASYARSVVTVEKGRFALPRRAVLFGPQNPHDQATEQSQKKLLEPLQARLEHEQPDWTFQSVRKEEAVKSRLGRLLGGDETPALLFAASHGLSFPMGEPRQLPEQGALLCQDWPGPIRWHGPIPTEHYFAAADVSPDARLLGLIAFLFAEFGAGCPERDDFAHMQPGTPRSSLAEKPFLARLPQLLLGHPNGGVLAVIGHIDRGWTISFTTLRGETDIDGFARTLNRLLNGHTVGEAMRFFVQRHAVWASELRRDMERVVFFGQTPERYQLSLLRTAAIDARNWVILGDPAVRLPLDGETIVKERPVIEPVVCVSRPERVVIEPEAVSASPERERALVVNGVNGETGEYLLPPMTLKHLTMAARGELRDVAFIQEWERRRRS